MSDLNSVQLVGRLTREPEMRSTPGGTDLCSFSIAVGRWQKKGEEYEEKTSFFNCTAFGYNAKKVAEKVKKGHRVAITGELEQRTWEAEDGKRREAVQINVRTVQPLEKQKKAQSSESEPARRSQYEDVPF